MTIDEIGTAIGTGTPAATEDDRDRQATGAPGVATMMPIPTCRAEATETESEKIDTRDATDATGNGIVIGAGAGTQGGTTTSGLQGETETSMMTDAGPEREMMDSTDATGGGARPHLRGSGSPHPI